MGLLWSGNAYAKNGTGDLMLSDNVVNNFKKYIEQKNRKPVKFLVTEDGKNSSAWHCHTLVAYLLVVWMKKLYVRENLQKMLYICNTPNNQMEK